MVLESEYPGPWPDVRGLVRKEMESYVADVDRDRLQLPTRCSPWTVRDLTAHLAATFLRFNAMLVRGRQGDLSPPFAREALAAENLQAVERFRGDALTVLRREALSLLESATDPEELMPHQFGPIPVALQLCFGLNELVLHHDDLAHASGGSHRPSDDAVAALAEVWQRALGGLPDGEDDWQRILRASGRLT